MLTEHRKARARERWNSFHKIYSFSDIGCWHRNANVWKRYKGVRCPLWWMFGRKHSNACYPQLVSH